MIEPIVYLAGPIAGVRGDHAIDWREEVDGLLAERDIEALNPMRAKLALHGPRHISTDFRSYQNLGPFFTPRGIMARDFNDVKRCDALLVNLIGAERDSLGTVMELGWAYAMQKPAIVAIEEGNPLLRHPMVIEAMSFMCPTLDEAVDTVAIVLGR